MSVLDTIKQEYPQMTRSEKTIAAYLLSHMEECENSSINELARQNNVSTTTLIRFARKLGFEGFKEFKQELCAGSAAQPTLVSKFQRIACRTSDKLLSDTVNHAWVCLDDTFSKLSPETIRRTTELLTGARRVYTYGMKESYALAHYAYTRLYTVRENVFLLNISNGDLEPLLDMKSEDVCLVFLFHRYTKRALSTLAMLKSKGVNVILVTSPPTKTVEELAEVLISCCVHGIGIKNTSIAPICLMDYLCNVMATNDPQKTLERFKEIESLLGSQSTLGS